MGGILENTVWNSHRDMENIHIFEIGNIYFRDNNSNAEQLRLSLAATGSIGKAHWQVKNEETDFSILKERANLSWST